jgi:hypothetical protein
MNRHIRGPVDQMKGTRPLVPALEWARQVTGTTTPPQTDADYVAILDKLVGKPEAPLIMPTVIHAYGDRDPRREDGELHELATSFKRSLGYIDVLTRRLLTSPSYVQAGLESAVARSGYDSTQRVRLHYDQGDPKLKAYQRWSKTAGAYVDNRKENFPDVSDFVDLYSYKNTDPTKVGEFTKFVLVDRIPDNKWKYQPGEGTDIIERDCARYYDMYFRTEHTHGDSGDRMASREPIDLDGFKNSDFEYVRSRQILSQEGDSIASAFGNVDKPAELGQKETFIFRLIRSFLFKVFAPDVGQSSDKDTDDHILEVLVCYCVYFEVETVGVQGDDGKVNRARAKGADGKNLPLKHFVSPELGETRINGHNLFLPPRVRFARGICQLENDEAVAMYDEYLRNNVICWMEFRSAAAQPHVCIGIRDIRRLLMGIVCMKTAARGVVHSLPMATAPITRENPAVKTTGTAKSTSYTLGITASLWHWVATCAPVFLSEDANDEPGGRLVAFVYLAILRILAGASGWSRASTLTDSASIKYPKKQFGAGAAISKHGPYVYASLLQPHEYYALQRARSKSSAPYGEVALSYTTNHLLCRRIEPLIESISTAPEPADKLADFAVVHLNPLAYANVTLSTFPYGIFLMNAVPVEFNEDACTAECIRQWPDKTKAPGYTTILLNMLVLYKTAAAKRFITTMPLADTIRSAKPLDTSVTELPAANPKKPSARARKMSSIVHSGNDIRRMGPVSETELAIIKEWGYTQSAQPKAWRGFGIPEPRYGLPWAFPAEYVRGNHSWIDDEVKRNALDNKQLKSNVAKEIDTRRAALGPSTAMYTDDKTKKQAFMDYMKYIRQQYWMKRKWLPIKEGNPVLIDCTNHFVIEGTQQMDGTRMRSGWSKDGTADPKGVVMCYLPGEYTSSCPQPRGTKRPLERFIAPIELDLTSKATAPTPIAEQAVAKKRKQQELREAKGKEKVIDLTSPDIPPSNPRKDDIKKSTDEPDDSSDDNS